MKKKNYKGRALKQQLNKVKGVCKTYDELHLKCVQYLVNLPNVVELQTNVPIGEYTTDIVGVDSDGVVFARECVGRPYLTKPMTLKLLDESRAYWLQHGVSDWAVMTGGEV